MIGHMPFALDLEGALRCPACHSSCLHQMAVDVVFRRREDEPESVRTIIDVEGVSTEMGTGYGRRDSLFVEFWCESCPAHPKLSIRQHKGATLIDWVTMVEKKGVR